MKLILLLTLAVFFIIGMPFVASWAFSQIPDSWLKATPTNRDVITVVGIASMLIIAFCGSHTRK